MKSRNIIAVSLMLVIAVIITVNENAVAEYEAPVSDRASMTVTLEPDGNQLKFVTTEIKAKAGTELTIKFVNKSTLMPHSVMVLKSADDIEKVGMAAMSAAEHEYVPQEHIDLIIANTTVAKPGETVEVTFTVPPAGEYPFMCPFPGHFTLMQGTLISEK